MSEEVEYYLASCPMCGVKSLKVIECEYKAPLIGKLLTITFKCENCGYRDTSVYNLELHEPTKIIFRVENAEDLNAKVIRSPTAKVSIPELGAEIKPGLRAESFVTNVEGVLQRILDIAELLLGWSETEDARRRAEAAIESIKKAMQGEMVFHLIIEDPYGNSAIIGDEKKLVVEKIRLTKP
ncbi:MAG: hypothetical protein DRJ31_02950 [Candidatus Methanomethylicota archaeon]|uniref:Zinc finger ZPR1-type domain-containing protein n=1 Tax=Thermoproteota archaeon TaxID=2056631 RepID=A0A497ES84_9CREN|nr:MAG: hypothetical protein DRJ31_02950 [Candidatus Verstraetearchaeota archaeon]